jgi:hypothetical protein
LSVKLRKNFKIADAAVEFLDNINNGWYFNSRKIRIGVRKIKSYPIFELIRVGGVFIKRFKRVTLRQFKTHFNINITNRVVGWTPEYIGPTRSKVVNAKNYFREYIKDNYDKVIKELDESCVIDLNKTITDPRVTYSAGYDTCGAHLKEYFKDNTTTDIYNHNEIIRILNYSNFEWFRAPICSYHNAKELFSAVRTNLNAYSGHYTSRLFGNEKGRSDFESRNIAHAIWNTLKEMPVKNMYLWDILGREKDNKVSYNDKSIKEVGTRVILTCENPITTLLMWFNQKMTYVLSNVDWNRTYNLNGEFDSKKYTKLNEESFNYDFKLEADWSYYDSNIDTQFLEIACAILTSGLPNDRLHRNISYLITSSVVTKYVCLPPGIVIELNRAQPSGHPFGTLVNCNVNLIYWCLIGYKIYGEDYVNQMRVEVYGDDTYAYFKNHANLINIDRYIAECGLKSDKVLQNFRSTREQDTFDTKIDYLKRRFDLTGIRWNHKKMFDKLLYPSRNRTLNEQVLTAISYHDTVPTDENAFKLIKGFFKHVKANYYDKLAFDEKSLVNNFLDKEFDDNNYSFTYGFSKDDRMRSYDSYISLLKHSFVIKPEWQFNLICDRESNLSELVLYLLSNSDVTKLSNKDINSYLTFRPPKQLVKSYNKLIELSKDFWSNQSSLNDNFIKRSALRNTKV